MKAVICLDGGLTFIFDTELTEIRKLQFDTNELKQCWTMDKVSLHMTHKEIGEEIGKGAWLGV